MNFILLFRMHVFPLCLSLSASFDIAISFYTVCLFLLVEVEKKGKAVP
jgi:hypothetical protein